MTTKKGKVETILEKYPEARDDDSMLILLVWWFFNKDKFEKREDGELWIKAKDILTLDNTETIRRIRQKLNEKGKYRGKSYNARHVNAENVRTTINTEDYDKHL